MCIFEAIGLRIYDGKGFDLIVCYAGPRITPASADNGRDGLAMFGYQCLCCSK